MFPAIAVAQALSQSEPDSTLLYVGRRGGIEEQVVPRYGLQFKTIVAAKLDMEQPWRNWSVPFIVPWALLQSTGIVREFRPDVVLGTGGYVSAPLVLAAAGLRVPVVLQEQNSLPGRTTRLLSRVARVVATAYPESARHLHAKAVVTGTPVRKEFWARRTDFPSRPGRLLILGGSQVCCDHQHFARKADTTRTCYLRLRKAALCPDELRRDGHASREASEAPKHGLREAGRTPERRRQGSNLEHPAS